ncbi:MAG: hypothetical protein ACE5JV_01410, partial [Nitrososphaerales archaeon]
HMQLVAQVDNKYELSCYLAIQYHALYFYRCDKEVIEIKKELFGLDERIASLKPNMESKQNLLLEEELRTTTRSYGQTSRRRFARSRRATPSITRRSSRGKDCWRG